MFRLLAAGFIFVLFLIFVSPSYAFFHRSPIPDTTDRFATRAAQAREESEKRGNERQEKIEIRQQEIKERAATRQAEQKVRNIERIKRNFIRILGRMTIALARLDNIVGRMQTRIAKLAAEGIDTSAASAAIENCSDERADAGDKIAQSIAAISAISSIDPAADVPLTAIHASEVTRSAKQSLILYRVCLNNVVVLLGQAAAKVAIEKTADYLTELSVLGDCSTQAKETEEVIAKLSKIIAEVDSADPDTAAQVEKAVTAMLEANQSLVKYSACLSNMINVLKSSGVDVSSALAKVESCQASSANVLSSVAISTGGETVESIVALDINSIKSADNEFLRYQKCLDDAMKLIVDLKPKEATGSAQ